MLTMVTSQNNMSHVPPVTGILLISAEREIVRQCFLLKQQYELGPSWFLKLYTRMIASISVFILEMVFIGKISFSTSVPVQLSENEIFQNSMRFVPMIKAKEENTTSQLIN